MVKKTEDTNKNDKVAAALALLHKKFGEESAMTFDDTTIKKVDVIPSGSIKVDRALGIGGWPLGRVVLCWGGYSSSKSTLALHLCANAQKMGKTAVYVDMEHAFDPIYAEAIGCDLKNLILIQSNSGDEALSVISELAINGAADVIILDSIAACIPQSELESDMNAANIGTQAKMFSSFFKRVTPALEKSNCLLFCINQARQKPGVLYGSPDVRPAGVAQDFYASIICKTARQQSKNEKNEDGDIIANEISFKVEKNKLAPPFRTANLVVYYGKGLSEENEVFDAAVEFGIVEKSGAWFAYKGEKIGQGAIKAKAWLNEHPEEKEYVYNRVKEILLDPNKQKAEESSKLETVTNEDGSEYKVNPETGEVFDQE